MPRFDAVLMGYHSEWGGIDNDAYIRSVATRAMLLHASTAPPVPDSERPVPESVVLELPKEISAQVVPASLCCYAMSGTDIARAAICLRTCYAMSGTDFDSLWCHAMQSLVLTSAYSLPNVLHMRYAMSGTDMAYADTRIGTGCSSRGVLPRLYPLSAYVRARRCPGGGEGREEL
eukprot:1079499-Rhodomonas_salina.1